MLLSFYNFQYTNLQCFLTARLQLVCIRGASRDHVTRLQTGFHLCKSLILQADLDRLLCECAIFDQENHVLAGGSFMQC